MLLIKKQKELNPEFNFKAYLQQEELKAFQTWERIILGTNIVKII